MMIGALTPLNFHQLSRLLVCHIQDRHTFTNRYVNSVGLAPKNSPVHNHLHSTNLQLQMRRVVALLLQERSEFGGVGHVEGRVTPGGPVESISRLLVYPLDLLSRSSVISMSQLYTS